MSLCVIDTFPIFPISLLFLDRLLLFFVFSISPFNCILSVCFLSIFLLYFSQKQLPRKMKSRLVITKCAGYIFWQLILRRLIIPVFDCFRLSFLCLFSFSFWLSNVFLYLSFFLYDCQIYFLFLCLFFFSVTVESLVFFSPFLLPFHVAFANV